DADMETQVRQTLDRIGRVLAEAGASWEHVVFLRAYFVDIALGLPAYRKVRTDYLVKPYPASTAVGVPALAVPELQVEIEAMAVVRPPATRRSQLPRPGPCSGPRVGSDRLDRRRPPSKSLASRPGDRLCSAMARPRAHPRADTPCRLLSHPLRDRRGIIMDPRNRREFLADVGRGMLVAGVGSSLAADLGLAPAWAGEDERPLVFGRDIEPLVALMQETEPDRLLPILVERSRSGADLG